MCHPNESRAPLPPQRGPVAECGELRLTAADGNRVLAYRARPERSSGRGVVILPDVRGLHAFYRDLTVLFAQAGFDAIAIDYFGRTAPNDRRDDTFGWREQVERTTPEGVAADVRAAVEALRGADGGSVRSVFTVGFCFGGANSWRQSAEGHGLAGCIGFYGGRPLTRVGPRIADVRAPILMLLAGNDSTPASEFEEFARRVRERGVEVESHTYAGAPHSFFDRAFDAHREACADAWRRILNFTERLGGGRNATATAPATAARS
jgi:carboxymethylenebutenolidase